MSSGHNPYGGAGGSYGAGSQMNASVSFGAQASPAAPTHLPDTTDADQHAGHDAGSHAEPAAETAGNLSALAGFGGGFGPGLDIGATNTPSAADLIKDTTTAGFAADVLTESRNQPVLVDFWAPWCGPCRQLTPVIEAAVQSAAGAVKLVKMNIDDHPTIAGQLGIQSIPAVVAFVDGQPVDGFMGALPESKIKEFIDKVAGNAGSVGGPQAAIDEALAAAQELQQDGDFDQAMHIYAAVLQNVPDNVTALAGLAGGMLESGETGQVRQILAQVPEAAADDPLIRAVEARLALAEQVAHLGNPAELQARLDADPLDHQARFDLAQIANALGNRDDAVDELLAIMKADREWNDDGARKQLLQFFEAWGFKDPAAMSGRRKLSSLLFA